MTEALYDTVNVNGETEYEEPLSGSELHEIQYIELQRPEGVYDMAGVAEPAFSDGRRRNSAESHEPQYMQIQQKESIYDKSRVAEQIHQNAFDRALTVSIHGTSTVRKRLRHCESFRTRGELSLFGALTTLNIVKKIF